MRSAQCVCEFAVHYVCLKHVLHAILWACSKSGSRQKGQDFLQGGNGKRSIHQV